MSMFLTKAPLWVWPLLVLLLVVGLRAARPRETSLAPYLFLPLLGGITLNTLAHLPAPFLVWGSWLLAYGLGTASGYALQRRWLVTRAGWRVTLRGEWLTLLVVLTIFGAGFATGVLRAIAPDAIGATAFLILFSAVTGLCAGSFLGRSLQLFLSPSQA